MTCKDCIHYEACKSMCEAFGFTIDGAGEAASERCEQFEKALENSEFADLAARLRLTNSRSKRALLDSAAYAIEYLQIQMNREHLAHLRLQDYDVSRAEDYRRMTIERNMLAEKLREKESVLDLVLRDGSSCWSDSRYELPIDGDLYLVIASGQWGNVVLIDSYELATYYKNDGWVLDTYPRMENVNVAYWMPLPEPPEEVNHDL